MVSVSLHLKNFLSFVGFCLFFHVLSACCAINLFAGNANELPKSVPVGKGYDSAMLKEQKALPLPIMN